MTVVRLLWGTIGLAVLGALVALSMWGIPAPTAPIEKVIPNDRFTS